MLKNCKTRLLCATVFDSSAAVQVVWDVVSVQVVYVFVAFCHYMFHGEQCSTSLAHR